MVRGAGATVFTAPSVGSSEASQGTPPEASPPTVPSATDPRTRDGVVEPSPKSARTATKAAATGELVSSQWLRARTRVAKDGELGEAGGYVLCWLRAALRGHENPAVDVAASAARALGCGMQVLITVPDGGEHDTARRHAFALAGAEEAKFELEQKGFECALQVTARGRRMPLHLSLAFKARLVVAEEPFVERWAAGVRQLVKQTSPAPVWLVDCSCVVPAHTVPKSSCGRAYQFEAATAGARKEMLAMGSYEEVPAPTVPPGAVLPPEFVETTDTEACELLGDVAAVGHTKGGSAAGYRRWQAWVHRGGLRDYAAKRNGPLAGGASRMSAYLNYGMVSPFLLAREVADSGKGTGPAKFANEFLTWRELSYAFCFHNPDGKYKAVEGLPLWAQRTLRAHVADPRKQLLDLEALEQGRTGDKLWDAAQLSLVRTGEMHNNLRMGWGKQVLMWSASPEEALARIVHLNDRFALDGESPPSYGGIMWCLGLFDGAKMEGAVTGTVRRKQLTQARGVTPEKITAAADKLCAPISSFFKVASN